MSIEHIWWDLHAEKKKQIFIIKNENFFFFFLPNFDPEENIGKKRPIYALSEGTSLIAGNCI